MKATRMIVALCMAATATTAAAQRVWTLDECVAYACEHNTQVMQQRLSVEDARIQLNTSQYSRLPALPASVGQSFNFGRGQGRNGVTEDRSSANTSFGISTSVPLFTGLRIPNQVRADRENVRAAEQTLEASRRELTITITAYYLNALNYRGRMDVAAQKVALDSMQVETARALVEQGKKAESELYQAQAELASSHLQLTTAEGEYRRTLLDLSQAINWEGVEGQPVPAPIDESEDRELEMRYIDAASWIGLGVSNHPTVLAATHQLKGSEFQHKVARSAYFPTLGFSAGYSNSFFHSYGDDNLPFGEQMKLNGSEYISLSLQIPLFNRLGTRNNVRRAKLAITNRQLALDETRRTLRKQIEQAQIDATNARARLRSALEAEKANEMACHYEREKYSAGKSTIYTLSQAEQNLVAARNDVVQARCELALRLRILKYYY